MNFIPVEFAQSSVSGSGEQRRNGSYIDGKQPRSNIQYKIQSTFSSSSHQNINASLECPIRQDDPLPIAVNGDDTAASEEVEQAFFESRVISISNSISLAAVLPSVQPTATATAEKRDKRVLYGSFFGGGKTVVKLKESRDDEGTSSNGLGGRLFSPLDSFSRNLQKFVHKQLRELELSSVYPPDLVPVFLSIPSEVKRVLQVPACTRRSQTLCNDVQDGKLEHPSIFARIVKSKRYVYPLLIRSTRLGSEHLRKLVSKPAELLAVPEIAISESETKLGQLDCSFSKIQNTNPSSEIHLIVLFGGKDMIALDWLPFISRFFNFAIATESQRSKLLQLQLQQKLNKKQNDGSTPNTKSRRSKSPLCISPLISIPVDIASKLIPRPSFSASHTRDNNEVIVSQSEECVETLLVNRHGELAACALVAAVAAVEYPGYGSSCGPPSARSILDGAIQLTPKVIQWVSPNRTSKYMTVKSVSQAIAAVSTSLCPSTVHLHFVGYSLGGAVALQVSSILAQEIAGKPAVLVAPFTSVSDWTTAFLRVPEVLRGLARSLVASVVERGIWWDNVDTVRQLCDTIRTKVMTFYRKFSAHLRHLPSTISDKQAFPHFKMSVIHGAHDSIVPFSMGCELASQAYRCLHGHQDPRIVTGRFVSPSDGLNPDSLPKSPSDHFSPLTCLEFPYCDEASPINAQPKLRATIQSTSSSTKGQPQQLTNINVFPTKLPSPKPQKQLPQESSSTQRTNDTVKFIFVDNVSGSPIQWTNDTIQMIQLAGDHQTILTEAAHQMEIFKCFYTPSMVRKIVFDELHLREHPTV